MLRRSRLEGRHGKVDQGSEWLDSENEFWTIDRDDQMGRAIGSASGIELDHAEDELD
jgi:hypothetical protein